MIVRTHIVHMHTAITTLRCCHACKAHTHSAFGLASDWAISCWSTILTCKLFSPHFRNKHNLWQLKKLEDNKLNSTEWFSVVIFKYNLPWYWCWWASGHCSNFFPIYICNISILIGYPKGFPTWCGVFFTFIYQLEKKFCYCHVWREHLATMCSMQLFSQQPWTSIKELATFWHCHEQSKIRDGMECMTLSKMYAMVYIQVNTRVIQCSLRKTCMHA